MIARPKLGAKIAALWKPALALVLLSGCSGTIVKSESLTTSKTNAAENINATYSLPKTVVTVSATFDASKGATYSITPSILPDNSARFRMKYSPGSLSDDNVTLGVDQNGLLSSVVANNTGRQGDILVAIASTAASVATLAAGAPSPPGTAGAGAAGPVPDCAPSTPFSLVFEMGEISSPRKLPDCSIISIDWRPHPVTGIAVAPKPDCPYSVCYRPLMTVTATIAGNGMPAKTAKFVAIDPEDVEGLNLSSAPFVARTHTVTFSSGLMTSAVVSDPSMALAIANLPLTIVKAILSAPAALFTLRVTNVQDQASLITQQTALVNAQVALQNAVSAAAKPASGVTGSGAAP